MARHLLNYHLYMRDDVWFIHKNLRSEQITHTSHLIGKQQQLNAEREERKKNWQSTRWFERNKIDQTDANKLNGNFGVFAICARTNDDRLENCCLSMADARTNCHRCSDRKFIYRIFEESKKLQIFIEIHWFSEDVLIFLWQPSQRLSTRNVVFWMRRCQLWTGTTRNDCRDKQQRQKITQIVH